MADNVSTPVNAKGLSALPHNAVSAPLRWLAGVLAEALPWFTLFTAVTALLTITAKHLSAWTVEMRAWSEANIESKGTTKPATKSTTGADGATESAA